MNFVENCKIYSKKVLVNKINRTINSYDDSYLGLGVTFLGT